MSTKDHIVVMAIDFGTTYSGYAFSLRSDFSKAIDNIASIKHADKIWFSQSHKIP